MAVIKNTAKVRLDLVKNPRTPDQLRAHVQRMVDRGEKADAAIAEYEQAGMLLQALELAKGRTPAERLANACKANAGLGEAILRAAVRSLRTAADEAKQRAHDAVVALHAE